MPRAVIAGDSSWAGRLGLGRQRAQRGAARRTFSNWATRLHSLGHQRLAWMSKGGGIGDLGPAQERCGGWAWRAGWTEWAGWLGWLGWHNRLKTQLGRRHLQGTRPCKA